MNCNVTASGNGDAKLLSYNEFENIFNYFFEFCLFDQVVSLDERRDATRRGVAAAAAAATGFDVEPRHSASRNTQTVPRTHRSLTSKVQCTRNVSKPFAIREGELPLAV